MIKVNVIGDADWPEDHPMHGCRGDLWISLSSAIAVHHQYGKGAVVTYPCGGSLLIDERPEDLVRRATALGNSHEADA